MILKLRSIDYKIIWSTFARYGGQILMAGISVFTVKLLTNFFSDALYSEYRRIIEYVTFFYIAANLGLEANIIRHMADNPEDGQVFTNALMLRMVSAGAIFLLALISIPIFVEGEVFLLAAAVYLAFFFFEFVTTVCKAMLQAHYLMGRAMVAVIGGKILYAVVAFLLVLDFSNGFGGALNGSLSPGNWNYLASTANSIPLLYLAPLVGGVATALVSLFFVRQKLNFKWKWDFPLWKELLWTGLPFGIVNILNNLYFRALPHMLADDALTAAGMEEQFGNFNLQFRIAFMLSLFSTALMLSVMPALKHALTERKFSKARSLVKKSSMLLFGVGVILVGGVSWLGPWMIEVMAKKTLVVPELWFVFPMFLLLAAVSYFYDLVLISLYTLDQEWWFLRREVLALGVALLVFGLAMIVGPGLMIEASTQMQLALIIGGAITGEAMMVVMGMRKLKAILKTE